MTNVKEDKGIYFFGRDGNLYLLSGGTLTKVSGTVEN